MIAPYLISTATRVTTDGFYTSVQQLLVAYYNAINRRDFTAAYSLWMNPPQTYESFAAGFADTTEAVLFYGGYQWSGQTYALEAGRIPAVVFGYRTDGSLGVYRGCFRVSYNALVPQRWSILGANLAPVAYTAIPDAASLRWRWAPRAAEPGPRSPVRRDPRDEAAARRRQERRPPR